MKSILIIGGTGSLGHALVSRLYNTYNIFIISRDEDKQYKMKKQYPKISYFLCDIRIQNRIESLIIKINPDIIIHASALKHIDICEDNIDECILTNIIGTQNVVNSIVNNLYRLKLETFVFISTDKATSPVNVYGMCKGISEKIVCGIKINNPKFIVVRYGNVLNSRGSLLPLFHEIGKDEKQDCFKVTNENMTRFFLTLNQGIDLIMKSIEEGVSGDIFIPKTNSYRIMDIAEEFSKHYNKPIKIVGCRPGEKIHECLINESESLKCIEHDTYYIIKPYYIHDKPFEYKSNSNLKKFKLEVD